MVQFGAIRSRLETINNRELTGNLGQFGSVCVFGHDGSRLTRAILREHALIKPWLVSSGQDEAVEVRTLNRTDRIELTWLVNCLAKLSVKEGGEEAARRLHRYLTASANTCIPADEIIVVHGLIVAERVDLGSGAYLAPYEDARIEFDLPEEPEPFQKTTTPNAAALVRSLEFGPGIGPPEKDLSLADMQVRYRFPTDYRIGLERWFYDAKFLVDMLSIAGRAWVLSAFVFLTQRARNTLDSARIPRASKLLICGLFQKG